MRRIFVVLSGLLVLPAFAEVAPIVYSDEIEYSDDGLYVDEYEQVADENVDNESSGTQKNTAIHNTGRVTPSRSVSQNVVGRTGASGTTGVTSRAVSTRGTSARGTTARTTATRATSTRATVGSRSATGTSGTTGRSVASRTAGGDTTTATPRTANTNSGATKARAGVVQTDTVNTPLYNGTARVGVRSSSSNTRASTMRISSSGTTVTTTTDVATTAADMDALQELTDYCKASYTQCMDNYCNVLDDNQGRCSCSANLKNYSKTEEALKTATESLQDIAQQIQYIGLTGDEITTLFTQTEAEISMQKTSDNTQLKNDLDKIKKLIVDVKSGNSTSSTTDTGLNLDSLTGLLDFNIGSTGFDLSALFGGTSSTNTSSINNQRGEQLYKTAAARCKATVLNNCVSQGVDASVITNAYDLEIDKQCIVYERALTESNDQMASTVRNAKSVLQRARLMVAQQKNSYDLRGCISALDSCMQDEYVCGSDYENCLDPSGKYIVNGQVVVGSMPDVPGGRLESNVRPAQGLYSTWDYASKNAWGTDGSITEYVDAKIASNLSSSTTVNGDMATYLQKKIGWLEDGKNMGMCMSVLNSCQDFTYTKGSGSKKTYNPDNTVVRNYLERVSMQIKTAQDNLLSEYAEDCISDVSSCLSQNGYESDNTQSTKSKIAISACASVIRTCKSVNGDCTVDTTGAVNCDNQTDASWVQAIVVGYPDDVSGYTTKTACTNAGCAWDVSSGECLDKNSEITTNSACTSLGGTWSPAECSDNTYVNQSSCESKNNTWTSASCTGASKEYNPLIGKCE